MTPALARYLLGCLFAFLAGHVINFGLVQWTQEVLRAPAWSGVLLLICFGSPVVLGWHGGALCDRTSPLRVVRRGHALLGGAALVLALLAWVPWLRQEALALALVGAALAGLGWSYAAPARLAHLPALAPPERLRGAAILFNVLTTVGFGGAPLILGQVRQRLPWTYVFLTALALLIASFACMVGLPAVSRAPAHTAQGAIRAGWRYIAQTPVVGQLLVGSALAHLLMGPIQVLLPGFLDNALRLDPGQRGWFLGMAAPALIAGGLMALRLTQVRHPGRAVLAGVVGSALLCAALSVVAELWLAAGLFVGACVLAGSAVAFLAASLQDVSDDAFRGRVMASYAITTQFFPALSGLICGLLLAGLGPVRALGSYALAVAVLVAAAAPGLRALRAYQRRVAPATTVS